MMRAMLRFLRSRAPICASREATLSSAPSSVGIGGSDLDTSDALELVLTENWDLFTIFGTGFRAIGLDTDLGVPGALNWSSGNKDAPMGRFRMAMGAGNSAIGGEGEYLRAIRAVDCGESALVEV